MPNELMAIIASIGGATIGLAGLILAQARASRRDFGKQMSTLRSELRDVRSELHSGLREAARERGELRERMAHLEGLLEGLREAITRRNVA